MALLLVLSSPPPTLIAWPSQDSLLIPYGALIAGVIGAFLGTLPRGLDAWGTSASSNLILMAFGCIIAASVVILIARVFGLHQFLALGCLLAAGIGAVITWATSTRSG